MSKTAETRKVVTDQDRAVVTCIYKGHDWEEFIDPDSGGFMRCKRCGISIDCEDPDGDLG